MSQLILSTNNGRQFALNVESFRSPIYTIFNGAQTKTLYQWFPIKVNQPELELSVQFASEYDYELFQAFVRSSQVYAITNGQGAPQVTLYWPQRNINNWQGYIRAFQAGGKRANYAPRASFTIDLATSLVASLSQTASFGALFSIINGVGGLAGTTSNSADNGITPPSNAGSLTNQNLFSFNTNNTGSLANSRGLSSGFPGVG